MLLNFDLMHFNESWINCNKVAIPKWLLDIPKQQNLDWCGGVTLTPEINVAKENLVLRDVTRIWKSNWQTFKSTQMAIIFLYAFILVGRPVEIKACSILSVCTEGYRRATTKDFEKWITWQIPSLLRPAIIFDSYCAFLNFLPNLRPFCKSRGWLTKCIAPSMNRQNSMLVKKKTAVEKQCFKLSNLCHICQEAPHGWPQKINFS